MRFPRGAAIRDRGGEEELVEVRSATSRRDLLGGVGAPLAALPTLEAAHFGMPIGLPSELVPLRRTREGRQLSRIRYHNAESFFAPVEQGFPFRPSDRLYQIGIAVQLALSSHLLDVGFGDAWCAKNIGLYVNKSLEHANATGLGHDGSELRRLADILSPYGRWRNTDVSAASDICPLSDAQICKLSRSLLDRVREVTGHNRPRGWRKLL